MAAKNNEFFWRLYLLHHNGCPLVSKKIILRELARSGYDLDQLLFDNKQLLERRYVLSKTDIETLFPGNKKTEIKHWGAHLFPCVILTLFSKSLQPDERKNMRSILNVHTDIKVSMAEASLDPETYDDHKETLCEALLSIEHGLSEKVEKEIPDLIDVFITQPLNPKSITGMNLPAEIKEKLLHFLELFPSYSDIAIHSEGLSPSLAANINEYNTSSTVLEDVSTNVIYERVQVQQQTDDENTCIDVYEAQESAQSSTETLLEFGKLDNIGFANKDTKEECLGSEDVISGLDKGSKRIATEEECIDSEEDKTELDKGSEEIVINASKHITEEERKSTELLWQNKDFQQSLKDKSFLGVFDQKMAQWEQEYVHVAVLGRTGVGKSRFINAFRSCKTEVDPLYAPVGSVETTVEAKAYPHPRNPRLILWDLPGIGTDTFRREHYVKNKQIAFKNYHIYLVIASDRFTQDEIYLAKEIEKIGKIFLFVRTRVDINLDGVAENKIEDEIKKIRDDCRKSLSNGKFKSNEVYLISSKYDRHPHLDFGKLLERLVMSLEGLKKEVMLYSLKFNTKLFIEDKAVMLQSKIMTASFKSAIGGVVPLPGFSFLVDYHLISKELDFYRKTLGVTERDLENLAEETKKNVDDLKSEYKLKTFDIFKDVTKLGVQYGPMLRRIAMSEAVESTSKLVPVIGSAVAAGVSYGTTYHFLKSNLDIMIEDARKMMSILLKETGRTVFPLNQK